MDDHFKIVIGQKTPVEQSAPEPHGQDESVLPEEPKKSNIFVDIVKFAFLALLIVTPLRFYVAQPFIVSGSSMTPTFEPKQYLVVDELSYRFEKPQRGDIIIFKYPLDHSVFFIKRVIGLPGEKIEIKNGEVHVYGNDGAMSTLSEPYRSTNDTEKEVTIQLDDDEYYVLGDNRGASSDSRVWGPLQEKLIIGRAFARLLPPQEIGLFPGKFDFEAVSGLE